MAIRMVATKWVLIFFTGVIYDTALMDLFLYDRWIAIALQVYGGPRWYVVPALYLYCTACAYIVHGGLEGEKIEEREKFLLASFVCFFRD